MLRIFYITETCSRDNPQKVSKQPNEVFVFADHWCIQNTDFGGNPDVIIPKIDKLVGESIVFTIAISNISVSPSYRAALSTGQCP